MPELEKLGDKADELDDTLGAKSDALESGLGDLVTELQKGVTEATGEMTGLETAAREGSDDLLPDMAEKTDGAGTSFEEAASRAASEVEEAVTALESNGLKVAGKAVDAAAEGMKEAAEAAGGAMEKATTGLKPLGDELAASLGSAKAAAAEATTELGGHKSTLESSCGTLTQNITSACATSAEGYSEIADELGTAYQNALQTAESEGQTFIDSVKSLLDTAETELSTKGVDWLTQYVGEVVSETLKPHAEELTAWKPAVEGAETAAADMDDLVNDVVEAKKIAERIMQDIRNA
jgi:hypothetical protein